MRVLDTDVVIEIIRGRADVVDRRAATTDRVVTTWVTACELLYGAAKSRNPTGSRSAVLAYLQTIPLIGIDEVSAVAFGELKASLERAGTRLADADLLIASIALSHDAILLTGNTRHYARIEGLELEDWIH